MRKRVGFILQPVLVSLFIGMRHAEGDWLNPTLKMLAEMEEEGVQGDAISTSGHLRLHGDKDEALMYEHKFTVLSRERGGKGATQKTGGTLGLSSIPFPQS
ncbi:hypothetical protein IW261DRAFT_353726 [Armillaria novae-zelandiae]|uniref:Uncharacterized protein n=1 Tax=Armillaria novae-zelandiae TaxID=153914 RepID=A0AA39PQ67_9AGAR|nr:hypothetical protein IW261DRAFT_353726 [Armillaria novae-zelandiae]